MKHIATIRFSDGTSLYFGPFDTYEAADAFAQSKLDEYADARAAWVDGLLEPQMRAVA